jgi:hypothetical protein
MDVTFASNRLRELVELADSTEQIDLERSSIAADMLENMGRDLILWAADSADLLSQGFVSNVVVTEHLQRFEDIVRFP